MGTDMTNSQGILDSCEYDREVFEERAAIMEFDGKLSRAEAERAARQVLAQRPMSQPSVSPVSTQ